MSHGHCWRSRGSWHRAVRGCCRKEHHVKDIVVLVPGIMGSVLRRKGRVVWGYSGRVIGTALLSAGSGLRDDLFLSDDDPDLDALDDGITADALMPDLHLMPGF